MLKVRALKGEKGSSLVSWSSQNELRPFKISHLTPSISVKNLSRLDNQDFTPNIDLSIDESKLPAIDYSCVLDWLPPIPKPKYTYVQYDDEVVHRIINRDYETCQTHIVENENHHRFNRTVLVTINRNHLHKLKIITRENNYHHFNTELVVKVNDIHKNRIVHLPVEGSTNTDFQNTSVIEPPKCLIRPETFATTTVSPTAETKTKTKKYKKSDSGYSSRSTLLRSAMTSPFHAYSADVSSSSSNENLKQAETSESTNEFIKLPSNLEELLGRLPKACSMPREDKPTQTKNEDRAGKRTKKRRFRRQAFPMGKQVIVEVKIRKLIED